MKKQQLQQKFNHPEVQFLSKRSKLLDFLDKTFKSGQSLWLSAPSGSGKTSLAATYASSRSKLVIWFSIDEHDNDLLSFTRNLYLASKLKPKKGEPFDDAFIFLKDALIDISHQLPKNTLWVWDNSELLADDAPHFQVLSDFLTHHSNSPNMLFISRRELPKVFISSQLSHRIKPLDWSEIRLKSEDAHQMAALFGQFPEEKIAQWLKFSDGWVALFVLMIQNNIESPSKISTNRSEEVFNSLAKTIFQQMDPVQSEALLKLSSLPFIPIKLACSLLQNSKAGNLLQGASQHWHMIEYVNQKQPMYRMHPLLRQFMRNQLTLQFNAEQLQQLHTSAAQALEQHGFPDEAIELYSETNNLEQLQRLILSRAKTVEKEGRLNTLQNWLEKIPERTLHNNAWLAYWMGTCLRFNEPKRGWPLLDQAYQQFRERGDIIGQYSTWFALVEAMMVYFEDLKPLKKWLDEYDALRARHSRCPDMALRMKTLSIAGSLMSVLSPNHPRLARLIKVAEFSVRVLPFRTPRQAAFTYLIMHYANTGQIARMHAMANNLLPHLEESSLPGPLRLFAHAMIGLHQIIAGDPRPQDIIKTAIKLSNTIGGEHFKSIPRNYIVYYDILIGDLSAAKKHLREMKQVMRDGHRMEEAALHFLLAWLSFTEGEYGKGLEYSLLSKTMCKTLGFDFGRSLNCSLLAQAFTQAGEFDQAEQELQELAQLASESGSHLLEVMHGFASAWLNLCQGQHTQASQQLTITIQIAQYQGIYAYPGMLRQIAAELALFAASHQIANDFIIRFVHRWDLQPATLSQLNTRWHWPIRAYTLGHYEVLLRDSTAPLDPIKQGKPLQLLSAIAAYGPKPISKAILIDSLWPDTDTDKAAHSLDNLIYRLRKLIGTQTLTISQNKAGLNPSKIWVDAWYLRALIDDKAIKTSNPKDTAFILRQLYQGDFLEDQDEQWIKPIREQLRRQYMNTSEQTIDLLMEQEEYSEVHIFSDHLLRIDPTNELVYLNLMKSHVKQGRQGEALRTYQRCQQAMQQYLKIKPGSIIEEFHQKIINEQH